MRSRNGADLPAQPARPTLSKKAYYLEHLYLIFRSSMRVDLNAIQVLEVVIREGSLAAAAKKLHRVQSAVIYQLPKLQHHPCPKPPNPAEIPPPLPPPETHV